MTRLAQMLVVLGTSVASLRVRWGSSLTVVISMACITAVTLSTLSISNGMMSGFLAAADPTRAIVLPANTLGDAGTGLPRNQIGTIFNAPGIAMDANGTLLADAETILSLPPEQGMAQGYLRLRGLGPAGLALRPELKIIDGRWFQPGKAEVVVGVDVAHAYDLKVGGSVIMNNGRWPIVGLFSGPGIQASELLADADTLMTTLRRTGFGSVVVRLRNPEAFEAFNQWLANNPSLRVAAETQQHYNRRWASRQSDYFVAIAYLAGALMSIGALFGGVNVLQAIVAARRREIAMLRALGYEALPVAGSVVLEILLLSVSGAVAGGCLAWLLFDGREMVLFGTVYELSVSTSLFVLGVAWALALALLGSVLPAIRAARVPLVEGLRAI